MVSATRRCSTRERLNQRQSHDLCLQLCAEEIFKFAKDRGWRTVLGQIDPGPAEERIVADLDNTSAIKHKHWEPAPADYWKRWRNECALADKIVVNSEWSKDALLGEGCPLKRSA